MPYVAVKSKPYPMRIQAEAWRDYYLKEYHPDGYGTSLDILETADGFVVKGGRWDSCD
jgi:hypothetical protein